MGTYLFYELTFGLHGEGEGERQGDVSLAAEIGNDCARKNIELSATNDIDVQMAEVKIILWWLF